MCGKRATQQDGIAEPLADAIRAKHGLAASIRVATRQASARCSEGSYQAVIQGLQPEQRHTLATAMVGHALQSRRCSSNALWGCSMHWCKAWLSFQHASFLWGYALQAEAGEKYRAGRHSRNSSHGGSMGRGGQEVLDTIHHSFLMKREDRSMPQTLRISNFRPCLLTQSSILRVLSPLSAQ